MFLQGTQVAQRLPGPEDVGKHLFEISPGRWALGAPIGVLPCLEPGKAELLHETPAPYLFTTWKFGSNLEDMVNLREIRKFNQSCG